MPRTTATLLTGLALLACAPAAHADDSDLDPTFGGGDGAVSLALSETDRFHAIAALPDGRFVAAGSYRAGAGADQHDNFLVARFLPDGAPDPSFSGDGIAGSQFTAGDDVATGVRVQADGTIVAVGRAETATGGQDFAVLRLMPDGTRDMSFDVDGRLTVPVGPGATTDHGMATAPLAGGGLVVAGSSDGQPATIRLDAAGELDTAYCGTGKCVLQIPGSFSAEAAAAGPGNTMLVGGRWTISEQQSTVVRIDAAGAPDASWGSNGIRAVSVAPKDENLRGLTALPDGSVLATGWHRPVNGLEETHSTLIRLTPEGDTDPTFGGGDGHVVFGNPDVYDIGESVAQTADGRIVAAATTRVQGNTALQLARFRADGTPDPTFAGDGTRTYPRADGMGAGGVALSSDRIVTAGFETPFGHGAQASLHAFAHRPAAPTPAAPVGPASPALVPNSGSARMAPLDALRRDTSAPVLSRLKVTGTAVRFTLSERARVTFGARGARTVTRTLAKGRHVLRLKGLKRGRHAARLGATDLAGNRAKVRRLSVRAGRTAARATAAAKRKPLKLTAAPDPAAPAGKTPKVIFTLTNAIKGREYNVEAIQAAGQNGKSDEGYQVGCANSVGQFSFTKAKATKFSFKPGPLTSYELGSGSPCTGIYDGEILMGRGSNVPRKLLTFKLEVPSMRLKDVKSVR